MIGNNRRSVLLGAASALLGSRAAGARPDRAPLRLGVIDLSFHRATAAVVTALLEQLGHPVERHYALHEACFDLLRSGAVDMVASAWLNASHGVYRARVEEVVATRALGLHYQPYAFWGVPAHVPASQVGSVQDLLLPEVRARMHPVIQGIGPGAGISRFSRKAMEVYRLEEAGYRFETGTEEDCFKAFEQAVAEQQWRVVPLWHPQFLHAQHVIRELKEPQQLFGGVDRAVLLAREDRLRALPDGTVQALDRLRLSNGIVSGLDHAISREGLSPDEAAARWMREHPERWRLWVDRTTS
ncbi:glycine betaine ABC transporter substrate-binding protein [Roseateles terrae]|uniref:Glycine betaine/proline transport system substrate-binding protein n=1 Tax=Roseateles terrae TaxID=431060 RepID=A0ABR6GRM7_9BURK|nr:glycine betaine ABC transporter substrate-binding protein [Roseateles terrae]MBB3194760.1 glycine betaine/proline transport system substrate-binding protein [Roseateles terrae]OWQ85966.1 glycine/betaine ABC transporter [Roseateles terrae]